jgi:acyl-CoA thioesterase-1
LSPRRQGPRPSCRSLRSVAALTLLAAALLLPRAAAAQTRYLAFGDSITQGYGDDPNRAQAGYPPRLQALLAQRGQSAVVKNAGLGGETTIEGVSRLGSALAQNPADVLLLMEGTNDVNEKVSLETITFNLNKMAKKAAALGVSTVHATIIPRRPEANTDPTNKVTGEFAAMIRELAAANDRKLADPFEVFFYETPGVFAKDYLGGVDNLHPNAAGYDLLAKVFADVLTGVDAVPPVLGAFSPNDGATNVPADTAIHVVLYDFGAGIDLSATKLELNGQLIDSPLAGTDRRAELVYTPATPLAGVIHLGVRSQDLASPPNVLDRQLAQFIIAGTKFLAGDLNRDGRVDGDDLVLLALAFGSRRSDARFNLAADLNGDGSVDGKDLAILAGNFGQSSF